MHQEYGLDETPLEDTNVTDQRSNLYKFNMANCLDEIVCRYNQFQEKCKEVRKLKFSHFDHKHRLRLDGDTRHHDVIESNKKITLKYFEEGLISQLGEYQAKRITSFLRAKNLHMLSF